MTARELLEQLEAACEAPEDAYAPLAYVASAALGLDDDELRGPRRRALLLLATGGDPRRGLEPEGRAVTALAGELDAPERRERLAEALEALRRDAAGLSVVERGLADLVADGEAAWRWLALALLAEELAEE